MNPKDQAKQFLAQLKRLKSDRGAMADLRRGLSHSMAWRAWPHLASVCNLTNDEDRTICETVAGAFGYHPDARQIGNIGTTCRRLATGKDEQGLSTFDVRFKRLLSARAAIEVCTHLRPIILAAKSKDAPIDYQELFLNLKLWNDRVRLRWAESYWDSRREEVSK